MPRNEPIACGAGCALDWGEADPARARATRRRWWGIAIGAVLAGNSMMLGLAINTSEASPAVRLILESVLLAAALVTLALLGPALLAAAWREARRGRVTIEALFLTGLTGSMTASLIAMATHHGAVYFETVIILLVVYALGHQLTDLSQRRALRSLESWQGAPPDCDVVQPDGSTRPVAIERVGVGDCVVVHPGRMIPVDATILEGEALIQQSQLTGEFDAVTRRAGQPVFAGSICLDVTLTLRVTAPGNRRRIDQFARAVEQARSLPSRFESQAQRLVRWFLPVVLLLALGSFIGWTLAAGWTRGLFTAMAVLLVACPCALGFAVPVSVWSALGRLSMAGIVPRNADLIETLASIDTVVFDKTGTLTEPQATLVDCVFADAATLAALGLTRPVLRQMIATLQRASDHPIAAAFQAIDAADTPDAGGAPRALDLRPIPGRGIAGRVTLAAGPDFTLTIGSDDLLQTAAQRADWQALAAPLHAPDHARRIGVWINTQLLAVAAVDERQIETGPATLDALRTLGMRLVLMTGDRPERAEAIGIAETHAGLTPEDKHRLIAALQAEGRRVLFIGDGINDAVAMTAADASLAVAGGAALAVESADGVLVEPDLRRVPFALALARRARCTIAGNLRLAVGYNVFGMTIAAAGLLHPVAAALIMTCSSLVVTWRALRLLEDAGENQWLGEDSAETGHPPLRPAHWTPGRATP